jgi:hypothetical protein
MKPFFCLLAISLLLMPGFISAQKQNIRVINCSVEKNASDNSYSIYAESTAFAPYTVKLIFSTLKGYWATPILNDMALATVNKGRQQILRLVPEKGSPIYSFNYHFQYFPGKASRRPPFDSSFLYLIPATPGNTIRVSLVNNMRDRLGQKDETGFSGTGFHYHFGDTICAARAGTVYECYDEVKEGEKNNEVYKADRNRIGIEHKDGSIAQYSIRAPITLLVEPGDEVVPGQPLAIFSKESDKMEVMFSVYYLDEKKIMADNNTMPTTQIPNFHVYLPTSFYTGEGGVTNPSLMLNKTFIVSHAKKIIGEELSKKEKKKLGLL